MRFKISILICFVLLTITLVGCKPNKPSDKLVSENKITSLKVRNIKAESKEVKDKAKVKEILALINSVKIVKSMVDPLIGL